MYRKLFLTILLTVSFTLQASHALDLPKEINLEYSGPYGIPAQLKFKHNQQNYTIETTISIPFKSMRFYTQGKIENNRLLPTEYSVYRSKKLYSSILFDYPNQSVTYGKLPIRKQSKLPKNTQDLFTIAWQMTINQGLPIQNTYATDGKKLYSLPNLQQVNNIQHYINNKKQNSLYFKGGENDRKIEIGLASELNYVPSVIVYYDKGTRYELTLKRITFVN